MRPKETTEKKLENIWASLIYHCRDLSEFLVDNADDPFFETELGKELRALSAKLLLAHTTGLIVFETEKNKSSFQGEDFIPKDVLKDLGTEFDI